MNLRSSRDDASSTRSARWPRVVAGTDIWAGVEVNFQPSPSRATAGSATAYLNALFGEALEQALALNNLELDLLYSFHDDLDLHPH